LPKKVKSKIKDKFTVAYLYQKVHLEILLPHTGYVL
jgi:hypothetical protein